MTTQKWVTQKPAEDLEDRVDDPESNLADLEAEFEKLCGEKDDMEDEAHEEAEEEMESVEPIEETSEVEESSEEAEGRRRFRR